MRRKLSELERQYQSALQAHLSQGRRANGKKARELGRRAVTAGADTLDLARVHERTLIALVAGCSPKERGDLVRRATSFFAEAITPIEKTHRAAQEVNERLKKLNSMLSKRSADLADANRELKKEIQRRKRVEASLKEREKDYTRLLQQSHNLQEQLRNLSRQLLTVQEEERKMLSRELHDEVVQTLSGINVQLTALRNEASVNVKGLRKRIVMAQKMVEKSVDVVHRFAVELRPPMLDDLGLIPALHSFAKTVAKEAGVRVRVTVSADVEKISIRKRTVLYRIAHEALTNVARHAQATRADVDIRSIPGSVRMEIKDNGKSFGVEKALRAKTIKHLGLLGMRERVEMEGGTFEIESSPDEGTTVRVQIPTGKTRT